MARNLDTTVVVRLSTSEKRELTEKAKRLGVSVSEFVRTKATTDFAEQVNAHTNFELEKLLKQFREDMGRAIEVSAQNNNELYQKLFVLLRADEY